MKKREILVPDITPLIDIIFILLIFFIVSSVFKKDELALILNLPKSNAKKLQLNKKEIIIELDKQKIAIYGKKVSIKELEVKISEIKNKQKNIIFRIDKKVEYERFVKVLDLLNKYQLSNISLVTNAKNK